MSLTDRLLGPILRADAAAPLITYYDDADGTRVELSAATIANWAAKTANWLRDECDVEPGTRVHVDLPAHWQTAGALLGAWWAGAHVIDEPDGAPVSLVAPDRAGSAPAVVNAVLGLDPLGRGIPDPPPGHVDFASEVRVHGDFFTPYEPVPGNTPALLGATVDELAERAAGCARAHGWAAGIRVLSTAPWTLPDGITDTFLAVLAAPGSLVHVANPDPAKLESRAIAERTSAVLMQ
ncbi:MAG TPA: TIGR03089 family protein [Pseudonocardiaceae bacterium]